MGKWIKNNLVLVSGVVLPLLLVAGFLVLNNVPRVLADPPEYDFLLVAYRYDYQHPREYSLSFEVRDGRLHGKASPLDKPNTYANRQHAGIFRYRSGSQSFEEIDYELPAELDDIEESVTWMVGEAADLELDKRAQSPDGYTFEYLGYGGRGGLLGEIFGMGRRYDSQYALSRDGVRFNLPKPAGTPNYYGHDLHFMGWVIEGTGSS